MNDFAKILGCFFIWGFTFPLSKLAMSMGVDPITACAIRGTAVTLFLLPTIRFKGVDLRWVALSSFLSQTLPFVGLAFALEHQPAGLTSSLTLLETTVIMLFGVLFLKNEMTIHHIVALALACSGVFILGGTPDIDYSQPLSLLGAAGAITFFSLGALVMRNTKGPSLEVGKIMCVLTSVQLWVFSALFEPSPVWDVVLSWPILAASLIGGACSIVGNSFWHHLASKGDIGRASLFLPLTLPCTIVASWLVLGETISGHAFLGCVVIAVSSLYATAFGGPKPENS